MQNQRNIFAVGPLLDLCAVDLAEVNGRNVFNLVVFVDHDRHMVGETRCEERQ
jgi:hypothetical protein